MEALQRQHADHHHHITVLKEQVAAKEAVHSEQKSEVRGERFFRITGTLQFHLPLQFAKVQHGLGYCLVL